MKYSEIMNLPTSTPYESVWQLLHDSVTDEDVKNGTDRKCFAYSHTIAWAVTHRHYLDFYEQRNLMMKQPTAIYHKWLSDIQKNKTVIMRITFAGEPKFGFYIDEDGEDAMLFPAPDGMKFIWL